MFVAVFARRLREGKTYEDFLAAWYPDKGFGVPVRGPFTGRSLADDREILTVAFVDLEGGSESMDEAMKRIAQQEAKRHDRIDEVIEMTALRGLYEQLDEFDFSSDETVEQGRPA